MGNGKGKDIDGGKSKGKDSYACACACKCTYPKKNLISVKKVSDVISFCAFFPLRFKHNG